MSLGIGLENYANAGGEGFGDASFGELQDLNKALSAGQITGRDTDNLQTAGSGAPLKVESLEKSLKVITYRKTDIVVWQDIPKQAAFNTVEEYNRLVDYGTDRGGFNLEGELPTEEDTTYQRKAELVKFLGTTRSVTHPMQLVKTNIGGAIEAEIRSGTMWILRKANRALVQGDSALVPIEFNGVYAQIQEGFASIGAYTESVTVVDLRGNRLSEEALETAMQTLTDNFGAGDTLYAPPVVLSNYTKFFYPNLRQNAPIPQDSKVGRRITTTQTQFGDIDLKFDKFMNRRPNRTLASLSSTTTVLAPVAGSATLVPADADSLWEAEDAGDYFWAVSAENRFGESALAAVDAVAVTVGVGDSVDLIFTDGGGTTLATAYTVYRSNDGAVSAAAATFSPIYRVSVAQLAAGFDGGAALAVRDRNRFIPNTDSAFLLENTEEIWSFKQLAPLMKMNLAILAPAYRFMILLYGTPIMYQPTKVIRFINVGNRDV